MHANSARPSTTSDDASVRIPVDVRRFPWIRRLAADYAYDFQALAPFFCGDPADGGAWADAIRRTQAHHRPTAEVAAVIAAQQQRRQAPAPSVEAARRLADSRTVAIVTGQQAGLFGGPLSTLLKALTAMKLAARVSRDHGVPAVAIFWIDAEDHDWDEVRSCTVFDDEWRPRTVSLPARTSAEPASVATILLDDSILAVLNAVETVLPATEFRASLLAQLRSAYMPGRGMAEAFGRWLERLLGEGGLIVYDSSDPVSKDLVGGVFARELSMPGHTARLAALAGSTLLARGYHSQVHATDDSLALFHLERGRRAIRQQDGHVVVGEQSYTPSMLAGQAATRPTLFSPSVLLRPIVQDTIFPTICYVAGPNELAYLAQLRGVYEHFGVPMPLMYPRATATLVDSAALRFLTKYSLPMERLQSQDEAALNELLKAQLPSAVEASFADAAQALDAHMTRVIQAVPLIDSTLEGAARSTLSRMQDNLQTLHAKMIHAAKRRDETLRRQFAHARALAFPNGHAQERTVGVVSFLNQYGPALVERLAHELPLDLGRHWIVNI